MTIARVPPQRFSSIDAHNVHGTALMASDSIPDFVCTTAITVVSLALWPYSMVVRVSLVLCGNALQCILLHLSVFPPVLLIIFTVNGSMCESWPGC